MLLTSASTPTLSQLSKPLNSGFFVFVVASSAIPYIHNNGAVDMTEKRIHKFIKFKASANEKFKIPGFGIEWLGVYDDCFAGTSVSVCIMRITRK